MIRHVDTEAQTVLVIIVRNNRSHSTSNMRTTAAKNKSIPDNGRAAQLTIKIYALRKRIVQENVMTDNVSPYWFTRSPFIPRAHFNAILIAIMDKILVK